MLKPFRLSPPADYSGEIRKLHHYSGGHGSILVRCPTQPRLHHAETPVPPFVVAMVPSDELARLRDRLQIGVSIRINGRIRGSRTLQGLGAVIPLVHATRLIM